MAISPANRAFFFSQMNTLFKAAYASIVKEMWAKRIATVATMDSETMYTGWAGNMKRARQWVGPRVVDEMGPRIYSFTALPYEKTGGIDMFEANDDKFGLFADLGRHVAQQLAKEMDYQLRDLIMNQGDQTGAFQTGVDGVSHWSASHPINFWDASFGTYTNDYRGAAGVTSNGVSNVGGPLSPLAWASLRQDIMTRKSESGEALGVGANLIMCGPQLDTTARTILEAEYFSPSAFYGLTGNVGNVQNLLRNTAALWTNEDLPAGTLDWFALTTNKGLMPFTIGLREGETMTQLTSPTDANVFHSHQYLYGGHARWCVAWGHPWLSSISGPTIGG